MARRRSVTTIACWLLALTLLALFPLPAAAHPSDFRTLTLDLIFGPNGLQAIDAAVVEASGPGYEPFPSEELRHGVAEKVLTAFNLAVSSASIDAELSERYHEVGFLIIFNDPLPGHGDAFQFNTEQLQEIAKVLNLDWMKLSVCAENSETFDGLDIEASTDGRAPANPNDRSFCERWKLGVADAAVTISVRSPLLPMTGLPAVPAGIAGLALLVAGILLLRRYRPENVPKDGSTAGAKVPTY